MRTPTTRRSVLLGGASAAALAVPVGAVVAAKHPDAELIALCDRLAFVEAEAVRRGDAVTDESDEAYAEVVHPIWAERDRLLDAIEPLRAHTSDGIAARVRALAASNPVDDHGHHWHSFDGDGDVVSRQLSWLLRDTAALDTSGNIVWKPLMPAAEVERIANPYVSPDAELIAACARFDEQELRFLRLYHGPTKIDDANEQDAAADMVPSGNRNPALGDILDKRAMTLGGMRALARSALIESPDLEREIRSRSHAAVSILAVLALSMTDGFDAPREIEAGRL